MKRLEAIWRETWWVWIIFLIFGIGMGSFVHVSFFTAIPISAFAFIYFMFMRYDEDGNNKGDL